MGDSRLQLLPTKTSASTKRHRRSPLISVKRKGHDRGSWSTQPSRRRADLCLRSRDTVLRRDAALRCLYEGEYSGLVRPKRYLDNVDYDDLDA